MTTYIFLHVGMIYFILFFTLLSIFVIGRSTDC